MAALLIGALAKRAGVSSPTIRYYEEIGLLSPPRRSAAGYRHYSDATVEELRFIRKAQALGFSLGEIGEILRMSRLGRTPCSRVLALARHHLEAVNQRIGRLQNFRDYLAGEVAKWDGKATPSGLGLCQIIASAEESSAMGCDLSPRSPRPHGSLRMTAG